MARVTRVERESCCKRWVRRSRIRGDSTTCTATSGRSSRDTYNKEYFANSPKEDPTGPPGSVASEIEFSVSVPQAGKYALTASVVTMNYHQSMNVAVNDDPTETRIKLPFTLGKWQDTEPVTLDLKQGENVLKFCRKIRPAVWGRVEFIDFETGKPVTPFPLPQANRHPPR